MVAVLVALGVEVGVLVGMGAVKLITKRGAVVEPRSNEPTNFRPNDPVFRPRKITERLLPLCQPVRLTTC